MADCGSDPMFVVRKWCLSWTIWTAKLCGGFLCLRAEAGLWLQKPYFGAYANALTHLSR